MTAGIPRRRRRSRRALVTGMVTLAMMLGTGVALAASAQAAVAAVVHTDSGVPVRVHSGPHLGSPGVGAAADGTTVSISCQITGDAVTGKYGRTTLWDKIGSGYISDSYVFTGSDGRVAPICSGGGRPPATGCSTTGLHDPRSCAQAVAWAKAHITSSSHAAYVNACDHLAGLAYGFAHSGSTTAFVHWESIPARYRHSGDRNVPPGGLAFFRTRSGFGHVMIATGVGQFASNDIHGRGTYTYTTISEITRRWGAAYLGWAQPWFQANH